MPPRTFIASPATARARAVIQPLATGVTMRSRRPASAVPASQASNITAAFSTTEAAASASSSISSSVQRMSGLSKSAPPNAARPRAWKTASSSERRMIPAARIALDRREPFTISIIWAKPRPTSPTT